jgi:hemoglobin
MTQLKDITLEDIKILVDTFYTKVQKTILSNKNSDRWPEHLEKCTVFGKLFYSKYIPILVARFRRINICQSTRCILTWMEIFTET